MIKTMDTYTKPLVLVIRTAPEMRICGLSDNEQYNTIPGGSLDD